MQNREMAKGTEYENEVADAVSAQLAQGNLGLDPALTVVRRKPAYFSRDRNKNIVFDVSVEVRRKGAPTPFLIWIWECKNYAYTVPVDDVEEFHAKLAQVGADRTKGTMSTPIGFDPGAVEFARSKGIGLCRFVPPGTPQFFMEDSRGVSDADILRGLTIADPTRFRSYGRFYALTTAGQFTTDRAELLATELGAG